MVILVLRFNFNYSDVIKEVRPIVFTAEPSASQMGQVLADFLSKQQSDFNDWYSFKEFHLEEAELYVQDD